MKRFLLLDFGTTSTKSTVVDLDDGTFTAPESHRSLNNLSTHPGRCEFALDEVAQRFDTICNTYYQREAFDGIALCSEMHGFAVLDPNGQPLSNYISWKDERSLEKMGDESPFVELSSLLGKRFKSITGMRARPGFAPMNFLHLARSANLPKTVRIVDLPAWLCRASGEATGFAHPTMLAGLALYDVQRQQTSDELVDALFQLCGVRVQIDQMASAGQIAGYWHSGRIKVPIFVGIGDHQCSLLGAGLVDRDTLSINLGTGAQVSALDLQNAPDEAETRPYFSEHQLKTITHIPGGRALAEYIDFLREVGGDTADFWQRLTTIDFDTVQQSSLYFGLGLFPSARGYDGGGFISRIGEGSLTLENYLGSLLRAFAAQYIELAELFDPAQQLRHALLSGGIARRLPVIEQLLSASTPYQVTGATTLDESLLGLRTIALVSAGRASDVFAAQAIFGRGCSRP
ncbi:MAG: sugar (pentulose or hexulose) kinase [Candidatus Latescibacterota bacterium]|jgi:sugar (pentulose or hexulose) kinase